MRKISLLGLALLTTLVAFADRPAKAQNALVVLTCGTLRQNYAPGASRQLTVDITGVLCSNSSGGGGGAVTVADGADVTQGALADGACATDNGTCSIAALFKRNNQRLTTLNTTLGTPFQAGGSIGNTTFGATAASGAFASGSIASGAMVDLGAQADAAWTSGSGSVIAILKTIGNNVAAAIAAGTNYIGQVGLNPVTTGGLSWTTFEPAASDNHTVLKAGAGQVYHISATNNSATINYLRLYNATTGFNGCNSATNLVYTMAIPASTNGAGYVADIAMGLAFATGISYCVVSAYGQNTTTNATASAMDVNIGYK